MDADVSVVVVAGIGLTSHLLKMPISLSSPHRTVYIALAEEEAEQGLRGRRTISYSRV